VPVVIGSGGAGGGTWCGIVSRLTTGCSQVVRDGERTCWHLMPAEDVAVPIGSEHFVVPYGPEWWMC